MAAVNGGYSNDFFEVFESDSINPLETQRNAESFPEMAFVYESLGFENPEIVPKNAELIPSAHTPYFITDINPNTMPIGSDGYAVAVTGENFLPGTACLVGLGLATVTFYNSPTSLTVIIDTIGVSSPGARPFTLVHPDGFLYSALNDVFTVTLPTQAAITSITPNFMAFNASNASIAVVGTSFTPGMTASLGPGITIVSVVVNSSTSITVNVSSGAPLPIEGRVLSLTDIYGRVTIASDTFEITGPPAPILTSIDPETMPLNSNDFVVTVTGFNFVPGMTADLGPVLSGTVTTLSPILAEVEIDTVIPNTPVAVPFTLIEPVLNQPGTLPGVIFTVPAGDNDPAVTGEFPPAGTAIGRHTPVGFTITDLDFNLFREFVTARFPGEEEEELVYDGFSFASLYSASTRTSVTGGFQFTIRRTGGWPGPPTVRVFSIDQNGNEL